LIAFQLLEREGKPEKIVKKESMTRDREEKMFQQQEEEEQTRRTTRKQKSTLFFI